MENYICQIPIKLWGWSGIIQISPRIVERKWSPTSMCVVYSLLPSWNQPVETKDGHKLLVWWFIPVWMKGQWVFCGLVNQPLQQAPTQMQWPEEEGQGRQGTASKWVCTGGSRVPSHGAAVGLSSKPTQTTEPSVCAPHQYMANCLLPNGTVCLTRASKVEAPEVANPWRCPEGKNKNLGIFCGCPWIVEQISVHSLSGPFLGNFQEILIYSNLWPNMCRKCAVVYHVYECLC